MSFPEQIVEVHLSRAALWERFRDAGEEGTLMVPGAFDLALGAPVTLRIGFDGLPCGVFLDGVVQARRAATPAAKAGVGVRFLPTSAEAARFASQWASGQRDPKGRREWRYPVDVSVILVTSPRGSTRIYPCSLVDVSMRGARAAINHRIEPDEEIRCEWRSELGSGAVTSRAVWSGNGRLGLEHLWRKPEERVAWEQFLSKVRTTLRGRVAMPSAESMRLSAGAIPAVTRERGFTPTPGGGSPVGPAAVNKVIPKLVEIPVTDGSVRRKRHDPRSE